MKMPNDLVPVDSANLYRYEVLNSDGTSTGTYLYLKYAPGALAQTPTAVNANLFNDIYGFAKGVTTFSGAVATTVDSVNGVTETATFGGNTITISRTDGTQTITATTTFSGGSVSTEVTG